jgi:glycosyltransferase involved in cell wall biosynthesis
MRIGIDARILGHPRSGIAVYAINLIEQFLTYKDSGIVLFGDRPIYQEYKYITDKAEVVVFGQEHRKRWSQFYLPAQLKKYKIDVYHAIWNNAVPIFTDVPSVLTVHDIIPFVVPGYFKNIQRRYKYIFSMQSALWKAQAVIVDASNTKSDLIKYFKVPSEKITVIPLGIKREFLPPLKGKEEMMKGVLNKFGINRDYIVNIGSFDKRRNVDALLRVFSRFIKNTNVNCQLVLIGGYDNFPQEISRLDAIINDLSLKGKVILTNYISQQEKAFLIYMARMMVHLSLYEGFCFPVLETMRAGIPVIASNTGSIPEVAGDAAILVDPRNEIEAAAAIEKIWNDKNLADNLIKKGYRRIENFSWEKTASQTREVYEKIS